VKQKLIERQEDREMIEKIIDEIFYDWEDENLQKELEKLQNKGLEKQKIIQKLLQKGFYYDDIKKLL
jgi:SOS response regulatory protein OraA/RecX